MHTAQGLIQPPEWGWWWSLSSKRLLNSHKQFYYNLYVSKPLTSLSLQCIRQTDLFGNLDGGNANLSDIMSPQSYRLPKKDLGLMKQAHLQL